MFSLSSIYIYFGLEIRKKTFNYAHLSASLSKYVKLYLRSSVSQINVKDVS